MTQGARLTPSAAFGYIRGQLPRAALAWRFLLQVESGGFRLSRRLRRRLHIDVAVATWLLMQLALHFPLVHF